MLVHQIAFSKPCPTTYTTSHQLKRDTDGDNRKQRKRFEDPMSHRIIEKRRRDRMNNCLADLSRLIPAEYLKKGRGRIEKTEIIEMAIKHMKFLQTQTCGSKPAENYEPKADTEPRLMVSDTHYDNVTRAMEQEAAFQKQYKFGYQDCLAETMHFLVELEGFFPSDTLCVRLMNHLQKYYEKVAQVDNGKSVDHGGSPENVVLPHTYDPSPTNSYQSSTFEDTNKKRSRRSSSISVVQGDDNSSNEPFNGTSQLREILVSPHSTSYYSPAARPNIIRHSSPESSPPPSIEATSTDIASPAGSLFKFKSYIKERFSAERSNLHHSSLPPPPKSPHSPVVVHGNSRKVNDTSSKTSTNPHQHQPVKRVDDHYASSIVSRSVPIFALHAKGAFYIPLSVDSNILTPFLSEWNNDYGVNNDFPPSMVLHPVTISVNFNRPLVTKSNECKVSITPAIAHYAATPVHIVPECR